MLRRLLIALDGSPASQSCQHLAIDLATRYSLQVTGLGVLDEPEIRRPEAVPLGGMAFKEEKDEAILKRARTRIDGFLKSFAQACVRNEVRHDILIREGTPHEEIAAESRRHDLIVIGGKTYFHFATREGEGDTLLQLARRASRPLLIAPPVLQPSEQKDIMVAYDDSIPAARALQLFQLTDLYADSRLHVVSVHPRRETANQWCMQAAAFLEAHGRETNLLPIQSSGSLNGLLRAEVETLKPQLLVMGSFGRKGLREKLFGSTTEHFLFENSSEIPIFLYH